MTLKVQESKVLAYPVANIYAVVQDVQAYADFLPWCQKAVVLDQQEHQMVADLTIGYQAFSETYRSTVTFTPHERIDMVCQEGPMQKLMGSWRFEAFGANKTRVSFDLEVHLRSFLLQKALGAVFKVSMHQVMNAFEQRLEILYNT